MPNEIIVSTDTGDLRGRTTEDGETASFLGVPYAEPPVGELRWRAPREVRAWAGVREATSFGPSAPQDPPPPNSLYFGGEREFSEDCLHLNVWSGTDAAERRPVLVWFHFGAYQFGSSANPMYAGEPLARTGCTVVTVDHRLGRLGFLAHPQLSAESEMNVSGNYGLLDQLAALRWVQRNIAAFGGDPGNVTIGGVSAGANSVHVLRASPLADGLFHRAIAHSGPGLTGTIDGPGHPAGPQTLAAAEQAGEELVRLLGVTDMAELRALPVAELNSVMLPRAAGSWNFDLAPGAEISLHLFDAAYPVVDGHLLPESPLTAYANGRVADVPFMVGNVANEWSGLPYVPELDAYRRHLRDTFGSDAARAFDAYPAFDDDQARTASWALEADRIFNWSNWAAVRGHVANCSSPAWHFRFYREAPVAAEEGIVEADYAGAFHASDVMYVFGTCESARPTWHWDEMDRRISAAMVRAWTNFMKRGDPNGDGVEAWPQFDPEARTTMRWSATVEVGESGYGEGRMALLDDLNGWR